MAIVAFEAGYNCPRNILRSDGLELRKLKSGNSIKLISFCVVAVVVNLRTQLTPVDGRKRGVDRA